MHRWAFVCGVALFVCQVTGPAWAQGWVGNVVFARKVNTQLRYGSLVVSEFSYKATVLNDTGDWIEVRHGTESRRYPNSYQGYVLKTDVVALDQAVAYFTALINADGKNAWALICRAKAWQEKGEIQIANGDLAEALRQRPEAWVYNIRGNIRRELASDGLPRTDFAEALRLDPLDYVARTNAGNALTAQGEYDQALDFYQEALRHKPDYARAFGGRGRARLGKGEAKQAIADFNEALRLDPNDATNIANRGLAQLHLGKFDEAIADSNQAIGIDSTDGFPFVCKASAYLLQGKASEALAVSRKCIQLQGWSGNHAWYAVILGVLAARRAGDTEAAGQLLSDAQGKLSQTWPYAVVRYLAGQVDAPGLLALAKDNGQQTDARCYLALHLIASDPQQAKAYFQQVVDEGNKTYLGFAIALNELQRLNATP